METIYDGGIDSRIEGPSEGGEISLDFTRNLATGRLTTTWLPFVPINTVIPFHWCPRSGYSRRPGEGEIFLQTAKIKSGG